MPTAKKTASTKKKAVTATKKKSVAAPKKRTSRNKAKVAALRSFHPAYGQDNFFSLQPTIQTFYWIIIGVLVVGLAAWTFALQMQITQIYDSIDLETQVEIPSKKDRA